MKKIQYFILVMALLYGVFIYYKGQNYNANDPDNSLQMMINLMNPLERETFLKDFMLACDDERRCVNLHGLSKNEIHQIALKKER